MILTSPCRNEIIIPIVIIHQPQHGIVELTAPLEGLNHITVCCYCSVGGIGVEGTDVAGGIIYLADVLREIPAVGVPRAIFLNGERSGGCCLRRIPEDVPHKRCVYASEVTTSDL